jgi:hypothetical protein
VMRGAERIREAAVVLPRVGHLPGIEDSVQARPDFASYGP